MAFKFEKKEKSKKVSTSIKLDAELYEKYSQIARDNEYKVNELFAEILEQSFKSVKNSFNKKNKAA